MKYEIHIGEIYELESQTKKPKQTMIINEDQRAVIEQFAYTKRDADLNTIYILNQCEFRILPHFEFNAQK